jgi:signal transduction histidine kinase/CheY-like chemotaxis protein
MSSTADIQVGTGTLVTIAKTANTTWDIPNDTPRSSFTRNQHTIFGKDTPPSGLEPIFGPATRSHLMMPFYTSDEPVLAIIASSVAATIRPGDAAAIRSVGSVLVAKAVQQRVVAADTAKTAFLSSISHELRTPMHSITAGIDVASAAILSKDWEEAESALSDVRSCGSTLQKILNDVLDYGRTTSPAGLQRSSAVGPVDLVKLFRDTAKACLPQYEGYTDKFSLELKYEERDWLVEADEAKYYRYVISHSTKLSSLRSRLLVNGLSNALKFCKSGPIYMSLSAKNGEVTMSVRDSGVGFAETSIPRLLEPFTKDDWHTPGAGLGLHITNKIAHSLGGRLSLSSSPGVGTTFKINAPITFISCDNPLASYSMTREMLKSPYLPIGVEDTPKSPIEPVFAATLPSLKTLKVLVVDDNALCRRILAKGLGKAATPTDIRQASDGQAALDVFVEFQPDLVLTDVSMPVMDGVTSAEFMRTAARERAWKDCKIYAITGLGSADPRLKSVALHGTAALDGWLVKGQDDLTVICRIVAEVWTTL